MSSATTLVYAVRLRVVAKYLAQLGLVLALLTVPPCAVAFAFGEQPAALRYLLVITLLLVLGLPAARLPATSHLQVNEALVIVALAFVLTPLLMSYPLTATGLTPGQALFEAVSGVTTTGLSTVEHIADKSPALWFARAWMQWYGGLGIVVLSVGLMMGHQTAARRLVEPFSPETLASTARTFARRMLLVYALLTVAGTALLWILCGNAFMAVTHVLSAVSTGGFSPYQDSLAGFGDWPLRYAVIAIAVAAAVPLSLYQRAWQHGWRTLTADVEVRALLLCGLLIAGLLMLFMESGGDRLYHALLLGFSAQSTAGFSSLDVSALDNGSKLVLIAAMAVGGGLGSTAGGLKLLRLLILLRLVQLFLWRSAMPSRAVVEPHLGGKRLGGDDLQRAALLLILLTLVILASWLVFVGHGYAPLDALFEVVSATGTVGLSTGITAPDLQPLLKGVLCLDMLLGRLEIIALLVLLYPRTWFGHRAESL